MYYVVYFAGVTAILFSLRSIDTDLLKRKRCFCIYVCNASAHLVCEMIRAGPLYKQAKDCQHCYSRVDTLHNYIKSI